MVVYLRERTLSLQQVYQLHTNTTTLIALVVHEEMCAVIRKELSKEHL